MPVDSIETDPSTMSFKTILVVVAGYTIAQLPEEASKKLSSRGQVAVEGAINNRAFQIVLEPDGNWGHWFKLSDKLQTDLDVKAGDTVAITFMPATVWPEPAIPDDLTQALATAPGDIQNLWYNITPMARWEWVRWVNATSNVATRQRRVAVSISKLQAGKRRPCCFNLSACTDPTVSIGGRLASSTLN